MCSIPGVISQMCADRVDILIYTDYVFCSDNDGGGGGDGGGGCGGGGCGGGCGG